MNRLFLCVLQREGRKPRHLHQDDFQGLRKNPESLLKRFRLDRQVTGSVILLQRRHVLFAVKVSRMELVEMYNTSSGNN